MPGGFFRPNRTPIKPWYERENGARYASDRALVAEFYPTLQFRIDHSEARVSLEGSIVIRAACGIPTEIATQIKFPWDYPQSEPIAYDSKRRFQPLPPKLLVDRHICKDGQCCLWLPPCSLWDPHDQLALRLFLDQLAVFFNRQLIYDITASWPGPEYDHGTKGYVQFIREQLGNDDPLAAALLPAITLRASVGRNACCPCGGGKKFKRCHLQAVSDIQRLIKIENIKHFFA